MPLIFTIGHSTRSAEEFVELLKSHGVRRLVDVRQYPSSRRYPHFNQAELAAELAAASIDYYHEVDLGGRRKPMPDSPNTYWRHPQFRGYADHQGTLEYRAALDRLIRLAGKSTTAIMCAEAVPWRCHRQLIADSLVLRGWEVRHILTANRADPHTLNPAIRRDPNGRFHYEDEQKELPLRG